MSKYLLGIDNGSTVSKVALFTEDGLELATAGRKVETIVDGPGWSERNCRQVWRDTASAIREVLDAAGVDAAEIAAVACTGYGNGLHLLDVDGRPTRNAVNSMDTRAQEYVDRWKAEGVVEAVRSLTAQQVWPGQPVALLAWLRDHEPDVLAKSAWLVSCKDYTRFRLCGEIDAELTDMSGTSLMSVVDDDYDDRVLDAFGLADMQTLLPPLVGSAERCGTVTQKAAKETGLRAGTIVAGGMFDIDACGLASGIVDEELMSLVAGTWGNNQYLARRPLVDPELFMTSCYSIPGWYLMLEGSPTSAGNLDWFAREFPATGPEGEPDAGVSAFDRYEQMAEAVAPAENDPIFLPFLYGSNTTAGARGSLVGLRGDHHRGHVARAVHEGIVFAHQAHLDRLLRFREPPTSIRFTGGAARSEFWTRMFADCFQIPIEIPAGTELGALGAAIAAAVACKLYPDLPTAVGAMTRVARRHDPDPAKQEIYAARRRRYALAAGALSAIWAEWNRPAS